MIDQSLIRPVQVRASDSASIDAFSRLRVSNPVTLFDSQQQFGESDLVWESQVAGTGAVSDSTNRASTLLSTGGTVSGVKTVQQTRTNFRYQPGKSQLVLLTFVAGASVANVRKRMGYFDDRNGIFLEQNGVTSTTSIVRRTYVTGSAVDEAVAQASWNLDTLDGNGPSGITLDLTKAHILLIDLQWLGVGRVRVGFDIDGLVYYVHEFKHANVISSVYMTNPNLPIRWEIENVGTAGGTATLEHICAAVLSEGGFEDARGFPFAGDRGATALSVSTVRPVFSVRAKAAGPNGVLNTGQILPKHFNLMANSNEVLVSVVRNGTLTNDSFVSVDAARSLAEVDTAATAISGGTVIDGFFVATGRSTNPSAGRNEPFGRFPLVYTGLLHHQDVLTLVAQAVTGSANLWAGIAWQEFY